MSLQKIIDLFFDRHIIKFVQGSDEWLENRKYSVGCSEHKDATGTKASRKKVIKSKVSPCNLSNVAPIVWGNLFESSTKYMSEILLDIKVQDCPGSIRHDNGFISCSADGISVCKLPQNLAYEIVKYMQNPAEYNLLTDSCVKIELDKPELLIELPKINREVILLFEYKSPATRIIDGSISKTYQRQVIMGLQCIKPAYAAIFYEASFELCELNNLPLEGFIGCKYLFPKKDDLFMYDDELIEILGCKDDGYGNLHRAFGRIGYDLFIVDAPVFHIKDNCNIHNDERYDYINDYVKSANLYDPIEFYRGLDGIMMAKGARMVMRWKLKEHGMHLFPRHKIDTTIWDAKCKEVIDHVQACKDLPEHKIDSYIKKIEFEY